MSKTSKNRLPYNNWFMLGKFSNFAFDSCAANGFTIFCCFFFWFIFKVEWVRTWAPRHVNNERWKIIVIDWLPTALKLIVWNTFFLAVFSSIIPHGSSPRNLPIRHSKLKRREKERKRWERYAPFYPSALAPSNQIF